MSNPALIRGGFGALLAAALFVTSTVINQISPNRCCARPLQPSPGPWLPCTPAAAAYPSTTAAGSGPGSPHF